MLHFDEIDAMPDWWAAGAVLLSLLLLLFLAAFTITVLPGFGLAA